MTTVSKSVRFEVFKRDSFTCQYCGRKSPEIILECDHIEPTSRGGSNELFNLVTACADCNRGKSDRKLSDDSVLQRQRNQLDEANARLQQMEMMAQWRIELENIDIAAVNLAEEAWSRAVENQFSLTQSGREKLTKLVKRESLDFVFQGIAGATQSYLVRGADQKFSKESVERAFDMIPRVIYVQKKSRDKPYIQRLYYARGVLRNRVYVNERIVMQLMEDAVTLGADPEEIIGLAKRVSSWTRFRESLDDFIDGALREQEATAGDSKPSEGTDRMSA